MKKNQVAKKPGPGRPRKLTGKVLHKKMFFVDEEMSEVVRNVCHTHRITFSELMRQMIDYMIEKKWLFLGK